MAVKHIGCNEKLDAWRQCKLHLDRVSITAIGALQYSNKQLKYRCKLFIIHFFLHCIKWYRFKCQMEAIEYIFSIERIFELEAEN